MNPLQEIEAAIPGLSREELERLRDLIEDLLEDQMELSEEVVKKIEQSKAEIAAGNFKRS